MRVDRRFFLALVVAAFAVGVVHADDPPLTEIEVVHPASMGFSMASDVTNGVLRTWLTEGYPLVLKRNLDSTLMWSIQTHSDENFAYLDAYAPSAAQGGTTTCCKWECDSGATWKLDTTLGDCFTLGGGCQICTETCTSGWVNCPAGTKKVVTY